VEGLRARRESVARTWALSNEQVLIPAGLAVPIAGTDQSHDFHTHPEFRYLAGLGEAGSVLTFDPSAGWEVFAPVAGTDERVWSGDRASLEALAEAGGFERVRPLPELGPWLERRRGESFALLGNDDLLRRPHEYGIDNWPALELSIEDEPSARLSEKLSESRRAKDARELDLMRAAVGASRFGHIAAMRIARAGLSERALQIEMEATFFHAGSPRTAYGSIVGGGPNGAILHSSPSRRPLGEGELLLIDAAAEFEGYAADITRTFPVGGRFAGIQRDLYQLVLDVQTTAIASVRPGKEYRELHLEACHRIAAGLVELDVLRGDPTGLVERDAHALFFPHGLGHMLGLSTHDAGGCLAGREKSDRFGLKWLRADLPLQPGYVVTIEPGIYFIRALLQDPARRETFRDAVNWPRVDAMLDFGGIRIEDDVVVTDAGSEVLSASIPKTIATIEALRAEGLAR
jgi:Xaa-Pro aminopeptidase